MKKEVSEVRKKRVMMRLNEAEYNKLQALFRKSTCRQLSEYFRLVALQKPVTLKYRNQSLDEILSAFISIKKELNAMGNNLNQVVHKLHILDRIPEFRNWLASYENVHQALAKTLTGIKESMDENYRKWSQK